jgi:hypothetical protein
MEYLLVMKDNRQTVCVYVTSSVAVFICDIKTRYKCGGNDRTVCCWSDFEIKNVMVILYLLFILSVQHKLVENDVKTAWFLYKEKI